MALISLIVPTTVDNISRYFNINNCEKYWNKFKKFSKHTIEIIFVEFSKIQKVNNNVDKYLFLKRLDDEGYKKTYVYNKGAAIANGEVFVFLDADIFVSFESLEAQLDVILDIPGVYVGYNGVAIYTTKNGVGSIIDPIQFDSWTEESIKKLIDFNKIYTNYKTAEYLVGNTNAVGGCLVIDRQTFKTIGGFNPNFIGWGYEDNEIISRAKILKIPLYKAGMAHDILLHAWHDEDGKDKSQHANYRANEEEVRKVEKMSKQELQDYISTWNNV